MKIIPAIDIIDGKCVRLSKGDYNTRKIYNENPVEVAREFEDHGLSYLHLVDLDGARSKHIVNYRVLEAIAEKTSLHIDFGGGLKTAEDIETAFNAGAKQITIGSIAVQDPGFCHTLIEKYGPERIILGADCENSRIRTSGWLRESDLDVFDFIRQYQQKGIQDVICTDISKDGMLEGPSVELYRKILHENAVRLIASGGISCIADIYRMQEIGCAGTIIGKAIYEGKIRLKELENYIENA
ncbi:1-(5-phosphoribosyl)-5-[(5-phosphoribosylamino)methylideneamino]imidazole-4-carboxamide isomerase [Chryseobacterium gossypii]|uniref:1-(5-phosphoribosyl)-5-[(5- phosphoribosylamino)methylideneamino]imidazole-4- carboxamide isomerase n=1 Tax=Chryseobacterium gossypii TaxID=3231602 RepID=UPI003523DE85